MSKKKNQSNQPAKSKPVVGKNIPAEGSEQSGPTNDSLLKDEAGAALENSTDGSSQQTPPSEIQPPIKESKEELIILLGNRKGFIIISKQVLESELFEGLGEAIEKELIPLVDEPEMLPNGDMRGLFCSSLFHKLSEGEEIPEYSLAIFENGTFKVERVISSPLSEKSIGFRYPDHFKPQPEPSGPPARPEAVDPSHLKPMAEVKPNATKVKVSDPSHLKPQE